MSVNEKKPINRHFERVSAEDVRRAAEYQAAILADVAGRRGTLHGRIKPLAPHMSVAGPAITVEVRPGDNLAIHAAMAVAQPGDVLIVDGKGDLSCALLGEIMATQAQASGIAGIIIDGAVRDADTLSKGHYPVFSAGLNPCGPTKLISGRVNHPISVAGATVQAGILLSRISTAWSSSRAMRFRRLSLWQKESWRWRPGVLPPSVKAIYVHTGLMTRFVRQVC